MPGDVQRILIVDADETIRQQMAFMLGKLGHQPVVAGGAQQALELLDLSFDLVLVDLDLPLIDGLELIELIRERFEVGQLPIILMTNPDAPDVRLKAMELGATDFLAKPFDPLDVRVRIMAVLRTLAAQTQAQDRHDGLAARVAERTEALEQTLAEMKQSRELLQAAYLDSIRRLAAAAEYKDEQTGLHIQRVGLFCGIIGQQLGLPSRAIELVRQAAPLHDVGKIGISDAVLLKNGPLDHDERELMKQHTIIGAQILANSTSDIFRSAEIVALTHHERWDGGGYPVGLKAHDIPLFGRICAVADVFDALTSVRPYKRAFSNDEATAMMLEDRGTHFDPEILDAFFACLPEVMRVQLQHSDIKAKATRDSAAGETRDSQPPPIPEPN